MKLYKLLLEQSELLEYSDKLINNLIIKFKQENNNLTDENIRYYISQFEKRKDNPLIKEKDISKYSFKELEKVIDSLPTNQKLSKGENNDVEFSETELIYNQTPLQIYHGDSPRSCIKIKGEFSASWCVSRVEGNLYNSYRYKSHEPSFYFVKNLERLNKINSLDDDPYCFFVIQITNNGEYIVTNSLNDGDNPMSWENIIKLEPLLNGKQELFKNNPLSNEEKKYYERFKDGISDEEYKDLSFEEKKIYISIKNKLTNKKFFETPKQLINDYITMGINLSDDQLEFIKNDKSLLNNYRRVTIKIIIPEYLKENIDNLYNRWLLLTNEETIDLYNKKEESLYEILSYKPQLINYFKDKINNLGPNYMSYILINQPSLINYFIDNINKFEKFNISFILSKQPSLINYFKDRLNEFDNNTISVILSKQPILIDYFKDKLNKIDYKYLSYILSIQPQLKPYFEKEGLLNENKKLKLLKLI